MFGTQIDEAYLDRITEDFNREQTKLMNDIKNGVDEEKQKDITKQITILTSLMMAILRLRNLKKKLALKMN
jgi:hypothetical protein